MLSAAEHCVFANAQKHEHAALLLSTRVCKCSETRACCAAAEHCMFGNAQKHEHAALLLSTVCL